MPARPTSFAHFLGRLLHPFAKFVAGSFDLGFVDKAVLVGVHFFKSLLMTGYELVEADFAIFVGIESFRHSLDHLPGFKRGRRSKPATCPGSPRMSTSVIAARTGLAISTWLTISTGFLFSLFATLILAVLFGGVVSLLAMLFAVMLMGMAIGTMVLATPLLLSVMAVVAMLSLTMLAMPGAVVHSVRRTMMFLTGHGSVSTVRPTLQSFQMSPRFAAARTVVSSRTALGMEPVVSGSVTMLLALSGKAMPVFRTMFAVRTMHSAVGMMPMLRTVLVAMRVRRATFKLAMTVRTTVGTFAMP